MKPNVSAFVLVGVLAAYSLSTLPLNYVAAQNDPRGMRVQPTPQGERRVALVIGNSDYKDSPLVNPVNDARAMAESLRRFGFDVLYGENLSQNDMKRNIEAFGGKIRNGGVGLFYYAGHGIQIKGTNYLIPISATITSENEVEYESVEVGRVLAQMDTARNRLNIVILDACRNNPFARSFRSAQKGLASIDAPVGTLIAYATAPGSVASDGTQGNGLYTQQLLRYMQKPELSLEQIFKKVREAVRSQTEGKQTPWELSSLVGEFYFSGPAMASNPPKNNPSPAPDPATLELSFWESIRNSTNPEDFKAYLETYPNGAFATLARNRANPKTTEKLVNRPTLKGRKEEPVDIPNGDKLRIRLSSPISTKTARVGDTFHATVIETARTVNLEGKSTEIQIRNSPLSDGYATVEGHIVTLNKSGRGSGKTEVGLAFDTVTLQDGRTGRIAFELVCVYESESVKRVDKEGRVEAGRRTTNREVRDGVGPDGRIVAGGKGAIIGLTVGGASGAGSVYVEGNKDLFLDLGTEMVIRVANSRGR